MISISHPEYQLKEVKWETLSPYFNTHRVGLFANNIHLSVPNVITTPELIDMHRLHTNMGTPFTLNLMLFKGDDFVGWSFGRQMDRETYYMTNSAILPEYRRQGLYTALLQETMTRINDEGFQIILSRHTVTNNAVIIPKLKAGFVISGIEVSDAFGTLVSLRLYTNSRRREVMDFRCGERKPDAQLMQILKLSDTPQLL